MRLRTLLLVLALLAAAPAAAQQTQTYRSAGGFALDLPAAWTRMPDDALDVVRQTGTGGAMGIVYEAGFQVSEEVAWPAPPYVAIAWAPLEQPMTREQFRADLVGPAAREEIQSGAHANLHMPQWDAETGTAWVRMVRRPDQPSIAFAWAGVALHPAGDRMVLLAYFGAHGEDEERVRAGLLAAMRTLRVD